MSGPAGGSSDGPANGPVAGAIALLAAGLAAPAGTAAQAPADVDPEHRPGHGCVAGRAFERHFDSGALWSGCARLDPVHGLELAALAYRAPGDASRPVLAALHPASILVQRAGEPVPSERLGPERRVLAESAATCAGEILAVAPRGGDVCVRRTATGLLAKYGDLRGVHGATWWFESALPGDGGEIWQSRVGLGEDGRIDVELALSGAVGTELVARAAWRVAFALDTPAADVVEELDFALGPRSRRPMRVTRLGVESFRRSAPERFRAWRALDPATGAGYLLDPAAGVAAPSGFGANWTGFELAVTAADAAERHAFAPPTLDGHVDGESLEGRDPVLWHAVARTVRPSAEDRPALGARALAFALTPFDWTARSPFETLAP